MSRAFSLAGLLRVRSVQEREAAQRLSRAAVEASQTQARDRHLRAALGDAGSGPQDGRTLAALAASRAAGRALLTELRVVAQLQEQTLSDARAVHDTRRREVRGLEKLAHAHLLEVRAEALRAEQKELDEIASRTRPGEDA